MMNTTAWADAYWPVTVLEPLYATMTLIGASEDGVTVQVRDRKVRLSWAALRDAAEPGYSAPGRACDPELAKRYGALLAEAEQHLRMSRLGRLSRAGYTVGQEEVGQRFGTCGVIRCGGRVVLRGGVVPFGFSTIDEMLEMALRCGLMSRGAS